MANSQKSPAKILVVDDDESNASILVRLLQHCGYEAAFELSGDAALKTAASYQPDVVFIDLGMPVMNGYELARQLRQQGSDGKPKLVSLTGYARGQAHGDDSIFAEYLLKPVDVKTLCKVIDGASG